MKVNILSIRTIELIAESEAEEVLLQEWGNRQFEAGQIENDGKEEKDTSVFLYRNEE